jgi:hypothetical protein
MILVVVNGHDFFLFSSTHLSIYQDLSGNRLLFLVFFSRVNLYNLLGIHRIQGDSEISLEKKMWSILDTK